MCECTVIHVLSIKQRTCQTSKDIYHVYVHNVVELHNEKLRASLKLKAPVKCPVVGSCITSLRLACYIGLWLMPTLVAGASCLFNNDIIVSIHEVHGHHCTMCAWVC